MECWYPVYGHPAGPSRAPWYEVRRAHAYRTPQHPDGPAERPCFRIDDGIVHAIGHPGEEPRPWFELRGSMLYPADAHPAGSSDAPWYQAR